MVGIGHDAGFSIARLPMFAAAASAGFMTGAGLIIAIGAQNAFVLRQGLQRRNVGLVVAVCSLGDIALILCGVAGIGALVQAWPGMLETLRFGGAAFLGWYGFQAARRAWRGTGGLAPSQGDESKWSRVLLACLAFTFIAGIQRLPFTYYFFCGNLPFFFIPFLC